MGALMLHYFIQICEYKMAWTINPLNIKCNIHVLISKSNNFKNCTGIPSMSVSSTWPNIMNINNCNKWQLSATYQPLVTVIVLDGCFHACMESKSLWFDSRKISFVLLLQHHYFIRIWLCLICKCSPVIFTPLQITYGIVILI